MVGHGKNSGKIISRIRNLVKKTLSGWEKLKKK